MDMPNLMVDALKTFGKETSIGSSVVSMVSDAKEIKDTLMGGAKTAKETYRNMRQNGFRKVTDWFYQRGDEYGMNSSLEDDNDDDFDAGFSYGTDDDGDSSQVLDYEGMKGIAKGQVSAMYNIAGKQAEATAMTASEVISNLNDRSSEILSSLGTINSSLETISQKLEKLIVVVAENSRERDNGFFDANGNLTLGSVFGGMRNSVQHRFGTYLNLGKNLLQSIGKMSPGELLGTSLGLFGSDVKFKGLGGQSINDISDTLTEKFMNAQNSFFTRVIENGFFKKLFGDKTRMTANKDYGAYIENQYTRNRAVFDGMTRKTIVDIIPAYLRKITEAVTGQTYHISEYGTLTTERGDGFKSVARNVINDGMKNKHIESIVSSANAADDIDEDDVRLAQRILLGLYVGSALDSGTAISTSSILKNGGDDAINAEAAKMLGRKTNKPASYWMKVITLINESFDSNSQIRESFVRAINQTVRQTDIAGEEYAQSATFIDDIGSLSHDMIVDALEEHIQNVSDTGGDTRTYDDLIRAKEITEADMPPGAKRSDRVSDEAIRQAKLKRARQSEIVSSGQPSIRTAAESTADYLASIFEILNRGVNVFAVKRKKPFEKMKLQKAAMGTPSVSTPVPEVDIVDNDNTPSPKQTPEQASPSHVETGAEGSENDQPKDDQQPAEQNQEQDKIGAATDKLTANAKNLATNVVNAIKNPGSIVSKAKNAITTEFENLKEDASNWTDNALGKAADWSDRTLLQSDVNDMDDANGDKEKANEILAAMQTAASDGDTQEDLAAISAQISEIKDPKLKARLERVVTSTLKRSENKKPAKSKIGGILMWAFGIAKKFLGGVFTKAKTFLGKFGKSIVTPIINSLKSSFKKITTGAKAVKEGFIGSKTQYRKAQEGEPADSEGYAVDENGNRIVAKAGTTGLLQDSIAWGKQKAGQIWNSTSMKNLRSAGSNALDAAKTLGGLGVDKAKDAAGKFVEWWKQPGIIGDITKAVKDKAIDAAGKVGGTALIAKDNISEKMGNLKTKFENSNFGKGFMEAWKDPAEEEKKKNPEPKTAADVATKTIAEILKDVDGKGEGGAETAISNIITVLSDTFEAINNKINEDENKEESEENSSSVVNENEGESSSDESSSSESSESSEGSSTVELGSGGSSEASAPAAESSGGGGAAGGGGASAGGAQQGGGGLGGKIKGLLGGGNAGGMGFDIGKMLGGMSKILFGIGQAVLTVIMSMEGAKAIMNLGMDILKKSLKPLNKAFQAIYKALQPIVKTVTRLLKEIVGYVVEIVQSVIKFIQPILEAIEPIISSLLETLMPLLDMVTGLVNVLIVPLTAMLKVTVIPTLKMIGNTLEILLGIVQVGMGIILTALGGILIAVGSIVKFLTGSEGIKDTGKQLFDTGTSMVKSGAQSVVSGMKKTITLFGDTIKDVMNTGKEEDEEKDKKKKKKKNTELRGSALEGTYGSGDESLDETFGGAGASQRKYGTYLNMAKRGCGPVAIADAYARRTGRSVDAAQLAATMNSAGTYSQNAGTSVSGYIKTSRALGMNLTPGGVTSTSLRHASPSNPITIVGSGPSFTTRNGNNHYMNVIGSDSHGTAYVSNPMSGKIERKNINSLATSSVMGLYGSGDENAPYAFSDEVQEALGSLKSIAKSIIDLFSTESSVEDALAKEEEKNEYDRMQYETADLTEEEQAEIDKRARELFEKEHGRYEGESDADFEKRYQKYKQKYWAMAAAEKVKAKVKSSADGSDEGAMSLINSTLGDENNPGMIDSFSNAISAVDDSVQAGGLQSLLESSSSKSKKEKGAARYESDNGAILWTDMYEPEVRKNKGSGWSRNASQNSYKLILDEFFRNTVAPTIKITGAFKKYLDPVDDDMVGTRGEEHSGADFTIGGNPEIHATTGGRVVEVVKGNDHFGNYVKIQDIGGDYHIYAHLKDIKVSKGDEIEGGDVIGTMGHSGSSQTILKQSDKSHGDTSLVQSGDRLHYEIRDENNEIQNPFTFFKYKRGGGKNGSITLDPEEAMIRAASEVFVKAAEASSDPGHLYHNVTSAKNITFDDGFVIDKIAPTHCTSMMGAVVKRMGYYTYPGTGFTETYQGEDQMGGNVAQKWGVSGTTGKAKIYNKDGSISDDWETGPVSSWRPGDIMFTGTGNAHAHMPVFKSTNGVILGFNGGADDSSANSIKLAQYYLENGKVPDDVAYNETSTLNVDKDGCHDHNVSDQIGAIAGPLQYYVRYVGDPVTFMGGDDEDWDEEDDWYDDEEDLFSDEDAEAMTAAGVDAATSSAKAKDDGDGVPYYWKKSTNSSGHVTNKAGTKLANWYIPSGNTSADEAWKRNHPDHLPYYTANIPGKKGTVVWMYNFNEYSSGKKCKRYVKANPPPDTSSGGKKNDGGSAVVVDSNAALMEAAAKGKGLNWPVSTKNGKTYYNGWEDPNAFFERYYASRGWANTFWKKHGFSNAGNWSDRTMQDKLGHIMRGSSDPRDNKRFHWLFDKRARTFWSNLRGYPDTTTAMRKVKGWPSIIDSWTNNDNKYLWKVYKGKSFDKYYKDIDKSGDEYLSGVRIVGNGDIDSSTIIPDMDLGGTIMDQITAMAESSDASAGTPIIVNQYATQQPVDGDDPVMAILTNTYNVRSEKIESILENMLTLMKERNQRKRNQQSASSLGLSNPSTDASNFSTDDIPHSVERLSVG